MQYQMEINHKGHTALVGSGNKYCLFVLIFFCFTTPLISQIPKSARQYFLLQQDSLYMQLVQKRMESGADRLDSTEAHYILQYESQLDSYFKELSAKEQSNYFRFREGWVKDFNAQNRDTSTTPPKKPVLYDADYNGNRIRYMLYALQGGTVYGLTSLILLQGSANTYRILNTLPIFTGVGSFLVPAIWTKRYGKMSYPAFRLGSHGINMGPIYGYALSNAILGTRIDYPVFDFNGTKVAGSRSGPIIGMFIMSGTAAAVSIASYNIGKNKNWHDSRALTLRTYARIGCLSALLFPSQSVFPVYTNDASRRLSSLTFLTGATMGYGIGHMIDRSRNGIRTRGEAIVAESFTFQGIAPGMISTVEMGSASAMSYMMIPATMTAFGLMSNFITRGTELTPDQGRTVAISSWVANVSLTLTTMIVANSITPLSVIPGTMGSIITAHFVSRRFKKYNSTHPKQYKSLDEDKRAHMNMSLMPSARLLSDRASSFSRSYERFLPEASLQVRF